MAYEYINDTRTQELLRERERLEKGGKHTGLVSALIQARITQINTGYKYIVEDPIDNNLLEAYREDI